MMTGTLILGVMVGVFIATSLRFAEPVPDRAIAVMDLLQHDRFLPVPCAIELYDLEVVKALVPLTVGDAMERDYKVHEKCGSYMHGESYGLARWLLSEWWRPPTRWDSDGNWLW